MTASSTDRKAAIRAVFLDRDGVICRDDYVSSVEKFQLLPGAAKAISILNTLGVPIIVVTNQPVVARGQCTEQDVEKIHDGMVGQLEKQGARIDAIYFCPHHPEQRSDIPDWAKKYRVGCLCRKPKPGMLLKAAEDWNIDLSKSWMVGDHERDMKAAAAAGCRSILVETGEVNKGSGFTPDIVCKDLLHAAETIKKIFSTQAVILVGGRGERLRPLTDTIPKPMLPIAGKPALEWQVGLLKKHGIAKIIMCGHYLLNKIEDYFGDGSRFGVEIEYVDDGPEPLGSGGALRNLKGKVIGDFVLLNGDVVTTLDITSLMLVHIKSGAAATMVVRETDHPHDSDIIQMGSDGKALKFFGKKDSGKVGNLGATGTFALGSEVLEAIVKVPCNLESDLIAGMISAGKNVRCYLSRDYFKDMGTPERYERVQKDFLNGIITAQAYAKAAIREGS